MKGFKIASIKYVEERVKGEGKRMKEDKGEERIGREKNKIGEKQSRLACPSAGAYAYHYILGAQAFPTPSTTVSNNL